MKKNQYIAPRVKRVVALTEQTMLIEYTNQYSPDEQLAEEGFFDEEYESDAYSKNPRNLNVWER